MKPNALFLDRDGVINKDNGYTFKVDHIEFIDGIFEVCRYAKQLGYLIFIVTNQAGIGRGHYSEEEFSQLSEWMCSIFKIQKAPIEKVYYSPFHPEHGIGFYKQDSPLRKPGPGMLLQAASEYNLNLFHSVLIGDKETDIMAGIRAGVSCNLLYRHAMHNSEPYEHTQAAAIIRSLLESKPFLESTLNKSISAETQNEVH